MHIIPGLGVDPYKKVEALRQIFRGKNNNTQLDFKITTARLAAKNIFSGFQHYFTYIINEQVCNYPWPL